MKYGDLTYEEIREHISKAAMAIVPTGCTEQQGPHLPVDFDTWFAEDVCLAASEKAEKDFGIISLVLPAMPFGPTPEHRNYGSGFIDIPKELHESLMLSVLRSLAMQGFQRIVIWKGCGQHDFSDTVNQFHTRFSRRSRAYLPELPYHDIWMSIGDSEVPGGHADSFTTSIMLYRRPEMVQRDKIANPHNNEVDWNEPDLDFTQYSVTGVIGDPTKASAELGQKLWEATIEKIALIFKDCRGI